MVTKQSVTKNSAYFLGSTLIQKSLTLLYFILVARSFGPLEQGRFSTALAFTTFFGVFIDLGLSSALVRESSRISRDHISVYAGHMLLARIVIGIIVYAIMIAVAYVTGLSQELISLIYIAGIAAVIDVITTSFWGIMRGLQNLWYESIGGVIAIGTMIVIGGAATFMGMPVISLVVAVLCGSLANLVYVLFVILKKAQVRLSLVPQKAILKKLLIICAPFAGAAIFSRMYTFADTTLVARLAGEQSAGYYAAGNKLVLALNMIPAAISASLYPAMSAYFVSEKEQIRALLEKSIRYVSMIALPIAVSVALLSPQIIPFFYGASYQPTIGVMQLIMPGLFFSFLIFPLGSVIAATNRQRLNTAIMGVAALLNIVLNIMLIPLLAHRGSAITFTITYATIFVFSLMCTYSYWKSVSLLMLSSFFKVGISAALMAASIILVNQRLHFIVTFSIACTVYITMLLATRALTPAMFSEMRHRFLK